MHLTEQTYNESYLYNVFTPCKECKKIEVIQICTGSPVVCGDKIYVTTANMWFLMTSAWYLSGYRIGREVAMKMVKLGVYTKCI